MGEAILGIVAVIGGFVLLGLLLAGISRLTNTRFVNRSGGTIMDNTKKRELTSEEKNAFQRGDDLLRWERETMMKRQAELEENLRKIRETKIDFSSGTLPRNTKSGLTEFLKRQDNFDKKNKPK